MTRSSVEEDDVDEEIDLDVDVDVDVDVDDEDIDNVDDDVEDGYDNEDVDPDLDEDEDDDDDTPYFQIKLEKLPPAEQVKQWLTTQVKELDDSQNGVFKKMKHYLAIPGKSTKLIVTTFPTTCSNESLARHEFLHYKQQMRSLQIVNVNNESISKNTNGYGFYLEFGTDTGFIEPGKSTKKTNPKIKLLMQMVYRASECHPFFCTDKKCLGDNCFVGHCTKILEIFQTNNMQLCYVPTWNQG